MANEILYGQSIDMDDLQVLNFVVHSAVSAPTNVDMLGGMMWWKDDTYDLRVYNDNDSTWNSLVQGPAISTNGNIPIWNGTEGHQLSDGFGLVTTIGDPGSDTSIVSEQGIRETLDSFTISALEDIDNVTITSIANNEILVWESDHWENQTAAENNLATFDGDSVVSRVPYWSNAQGLLNDGYLVSVDLNVDNSSDYLARADAIKNYVDASVLTEDFWDRTGTVIYPRISGDTLQIDGITEQILDAGVIIEEVKFENQVISNVAYIDFDLTDGYPHQEGRVHWDDNDKTLVIDLEGGTGVALQTGQEMHIRATNKTGSTILNGSIVYTTGAQGQRPTIALAQANFPWTAAPTLGIVTHDIADNNTGYITIFGLVRDIDTSAFTDGDLLWLSPTVAGGATTTKPSAPNTAVIVGIVLYAHATEGIIFTESATWQNLSDMPDVTITSGAVGDLLVRDSTNVFWENKQFADLSYWNRTGTILTPKITGDTLAVGGINEEALDAGVIIEQVKIEDGTFYTSLTSMTFEDGTGGPYTLAQLYSSGGTFIGQSDTPADWTGGVTGFMVMVNSTPDALEFVNPSEYPINNFSGILTDNWIITGSNSNVWRVQSSHAATGSVYVEFSNSGKAFNVASWSADDYTGNYGTLYVDDVEINLTLDNSVNQKIIAITTSAMTITDAISSTGFIYAADYSTAGSALNRWIPDWEAVTTQLGGNSIHTTIISPTNTEDGMVVFWDDGNSRYDLKAPAGGGAHNLLSATHSDTTTSAVVRGDIIIGNSTPNWTKLAISATTTHLLRTDGSDISWGAFNFADLGSSSHTHGNITNVGAIGSTTNLPIITTTSGVLIASSFGTGSNTFCEGDDSRLSDARTPTSHASSHLNSGGDTISLFNIASTVSGLVVGSDGVGSTYYLDATGTWSEPATGGSPGGSDTHVQFNDSGSFGGNANFTFNDYQVQVTNTTAHVAWDDFPTALPSIRTFYASRGASVYGTNNYSSIMLHAKPTSGQNAYMALALEAIGGSDHSSRFNMLLRGVNSEDYETVFSADYDSIYYWKRDSDLDITHQFIANAIVRGIIGYDQSNDSINIEGGTGTTFSSTPEIAVKDGGVTIKIDSTPATNTAEGIIAIGGVDVNAYGIGAALTLKSDGNYDTCDATTSAGMPCSALAVESGTGAGKKLLLMGYMSDPSYSFTVGEIVYVSETTGDLTTTVPSGTDVMVQAVGVAITSTGLYFNPDFAMVEIV